MARSITVERAKGRVRQQRRRDRMALTKAPATHTVNRAIVGALMQCVELNRQSGVHRMLTPMTLNELLPRAMAILALDAGGVSTYDVDEVIRAIHCRFSKQADPWLTGQSTARMARDDITPKS